MTRNFLSLLILSVLLTGCADSGDSISNQEPIDSSALRIEATAAPTSLKRGETMEIELVITNTGDEPASRQFTSGCIYGFGLRNADGEIVAPPPPICTLNLPVVEYQPGEVVKHTFQWAWEDQDLEPGTYARVAGLGARGEMEEAPPIPVELR